MQPGTTGKKKIMNLIKNEGRVGIFRLLEKLLGFLNHTGKLWSQISLIRVWSGWLWFFWIFTKRDPLASMKHVIKLAWPKGLSTHNRHGEN